MENIKTINFGQEVKKCFDNLSFGVKTDVKKEVITETCIKHGAFQCTKFTMSDGSFVKSPCPECEKELAEWEVAKEQQELENKTLSVKAPDIDKAALYKKCRIEPEFYNVKLDDFVPKSRAQELAKSAVEKMIKTGKGKIVLIGTNGVGKSMLGNIAAKEMGGEIYTMFEISAIIRQTYTARAVQTELDFLNHLASIKLLVIDEYSRSKDSQAQQNWLSYVLNKRHERFLPFFLIGNGHLKKQCKLGGCEKCVENLIDNDLLSRLQQDSAIIYINAPDERKGGVE